MKKSQRRFSNNHLYLCHVFASSNFMLGFLYSMTKADELVEGKKLREKENKVWEEKPHEIIIIFFPHHRFGMCNEAKLRKGPRLSPLFLFPCLKKPAVPLIK